MKDYTITSSCDFGKRNRRVDSTTAAVYNTDSNITAKERWMKSREK